MCDQAIGEEFVKDLMHLRKLNNLVEVDAFIRDVAKIKQVKKFIIFMY